MAEEQRAQFEGDMDFFGWLYWIDKGNPVPLEDEDPLQAMEALEDEVLEEDTNDEGFVGEDDTANVTGKAKSIPSKEMLNDEMMVCSTLSFVAIDSRIEKFNLCLECYRRYANIAPAAIHRHWDAHMIVRLSECPRPMCNFCKRALYLIRPAEVCITCNGHTLNHVVNI